MSETKQDHYDGGCLCGSVRFRACGRAGKPHTCSCRICQRHTGAPTAAWVEFSRGSVTWTGQGGAPATFRSSAYSSRAFCARCGSTIGAIDDEPVVALLIGVFDEPGNPDLMPASHSYPESRPGWWHVEAKLQEDC